ncbi:hypothetical protein L1887_09718 [Cichorium endivia]|nr:hypothetical protein L1887_09718 [Cichorium endivia]
MCAGQEWVLSLAFPNLVCAKVARLGLNSFVSPTEFGFVSSAVLHPCPSTSRTTSIIALRQRRPSSFLPLRQRRALITIFSLFFSLKSLFYWNQFTICIRCWIITLYYLYNWHQ